jgi:hypothetical protein
VANSQPHKSSGRPRFFLRSGVRAHTPASRHTDTPTPCRSRRQQVTSSSSFHQPLASPRDGNRTERRRATATNVPLRPGQGSAATSWSPRIWWTMQHGAAAPPPTAHVAVHLQAANPRRGISLGLRHYRLCIIKNEKRPALLDGRPGRVSSLISGVTRHRMGYGCPWPIPSMLP